MFDDLRFALRRLRHAPGFAAVAILTLAVGVGANTAILSIADGVLFRPLPYRDPDRVHLLMTAGRSSGRRGTIVSYRMIAALNERHNGLGEVGLFEQGPRPRIDTPDGPRLVPVLEASAGYFRVLGVRPRLGRIFGDGDAPGRAAILTYTGWQTHAGGDPAVIGRTLALGTSSFDVIGVLGPGFVFPTTPFFSGKAEIVTLLDAAALGNSNAFFHPVVRLESGVTVEQADAETDTILASVRAEDPKLKDATLVLGDVRETMYPVGRPIMRFLLMAAMLVLLVGCANLANMLLARARRQERETAVRAALGASRIRVIRPLVFEALLIGVAGSAVALIVTTLMFDLLRQAVPNAALGGSAVGVDGRIVWMGIALGLAGGFIFAGVPAWRAMRVDVIALLHGRHRSRRGRSVLGRPMLALQVALAIVLVFGAGVATRAFVDVLRTPIGFNHDGVVQLGVGPPSPDGRTEFYRRLIDLLEARTDVIAVGAAGSPPLSGMTGWSGVRRPGSNDMLAAIFHVTPGFFEALGIAPTSGRLLTWDDAMRAPHAVLSASAARSLFPGLNPLAQVVDDGTQRWQVAGIIPDIPSDVQRGVPPVYVIPTGRTTSMTIFARMRGDARMLPDELRRDIRRVVPEAPVDAGWWSDAIGSLTQYKNPRFQTMVLGSFASIALALTALGIFGVVAFIVTARTREMGIRVAIGAQPGSLVGLVVRQALIPVGLGLLLGLIATQWAAKLAESQLFKVQTRDPWMLAMTAAAVVAAALLAAWLPARRAARVDPIVVLRTE